MQSILLLMRIRHQMLLALLLAPVLPLPRTSFAQIAAQNTPPLPTTVPETPDNTTTAPPDAPGEPHPQLLADAMKKAKMSRPIIVMAVGVDGEQRDKIAVGAIEKVAELFELGQRQFGSVLAIGPKTMTVLETNFGEPSPYDDIPPSEAMTLLMSTLTAAQRSKLMGKDGLGMSDLTDPMQQNMFLATIPNKNGDVIVRKTERQGDNLISVTDIATKASGAKLRIRQEVRFTTKGQHDNWIPTNTPRANIKGPQYELPDYSGYDEADKLNGIEVNPDVPNRLKAGQLNLYNPALQVAISPDGVKTVGELMERIAKATKLEIYADVHYEKRSIALRLGRQTASAADFLRALAFSLTGAYRKIGPAYLLTDDVTGAGTRRKIISDYEDECSALRYPALKAAEKSVQENPAVQNAKLASTDESLALTEAQKKAGKKPEFDMGGMSNVSLPFDKLTPDQQQYLNSYKAEQEALAKSNPQDEIDIPDLNKDVVAICQPVVELSLSGIEGPIRTEFGTQMTGLFRKPDPAFNWDAEAYKKMLAAKTSAKAWADAQTKFARRGWIARPRSRNAVDDALRRLKKYGLNELWMVVFEDGKSLIPNTPFPLIASLRDAPDLLTYAIEAAKAQNVKVCPVVELFSWGSDAPREWRDLTLRGEDSEQDMARRYRLRVQKAIGDGKKLPEPPGRTVWVNPYNAGVQKKLRGMMLAIAAHPGLGDWVWNDAVPPGYAGQQFIMSDRTPPLGYNETARLAFVRAAHLDPIDFQSNVDYGSTHRANTTLPNYDSYQVELGSLQDIVSKWNQVQENLLRNTLTAFYKETIAALPEKSRPNLRVMQGSKAVYQVWYDVWTPMMQDAPPFSDQLVSFASGVNSFDGMTAFAAPAKPATGCYYLLLPRHYGPLAIAEKDIPNVLGLNIQEIAATKTREWDSLVVEEGDFDFDF